MALILLAHDGSAIARRAHARGIDLLGPDHDYLLVGVVPPTYLPGAPLSPMDAAHVTIPDLETEIAVEHQERKAMEDSMAEAIAELQIAATTRIELGDPASTLCEVAKEVDAGAIVMGSHGHGLLTRVIMGSVSTHVLHHAPCPVLIVSKDA